MRSKLCVILIADITGYTQFLSRAGGSDIIALVNQQKNLLAPLIENRPGRVIKWMGDAVLAAFDSATEAILCGRDMHEIMTRATERGAGVLDPNMKVVVHVGDVQLDDDGDIYGDPVNLTARLEKVAASADVYFTEAVRQVIAKAEIPHERFGTFDFKGIADPVDVFRTCFEASPVLLQHAALVQTNFTHIHDLASDRGWEFLHPLLDRLTETIIDISRMHGGTNRGVMNTGCFLTFPDVDNALAASRQWQLRTEKIVIDAGVDPERLRVRAAIHFGELSVLKFTMMGRDIDIVRILVSLGTGKEVLLSAPAKTLLKDDADKCRKIPFDELRDCRSKRSWSSKFAEIDVFQSVVLK